MPAPRLQPRIWNHFARFCAAWLAFALWLSQPSIDGVFAIVVGTDRLAWSASAIERWTDTGAGGATARPTLA